MLTTDRVAGAALVLVGLATLWQSRLLPFGSLARPGPAYVPVLLALLLTIFGVTVAVRGGKSPHVSAVGWGEWRHAVGILVAGAFAAVFLERLGYRTTMSVVMVFLLLVLERQRPLPSVVLALAVALGSFHVFDSWLRVPLPRGPFGL